MYNMTNSSLAYPQKHTKKVEAFLAWTKETLRYHKNSSKAATQRLFNLATDHKKLKFCSRISNLTFKKSRYHLLFPTPLLLQVHPFMLTVAKRGLIILIKSSTRQMHIVRLIFDGEILMKTLKYFVKSFSITN